MREMMALWCCLAIGRIAAAAPVDPVLHRHRVVLRLDVDVRGRR